MWTKTLQAIKVKICTIDFNGKDTNRDNDNWHQPWGHISPCEWSWLLYSLPSFVFCLLTCQVRAQPTSRDRLPCICFSGVHQDTISQGKQSAKMENFGGVNMVSGLKRLRLHSSKDQTDYKAQDVNMFVSARHVMWNKRQTRKMKHAA